MFRGPYHERSFATEVDNLTKASRAPQAARVVRLLESFRDAAMGNCCCMVVTPLCEMSLESVLKDRQYDLPTAIRWARELAQTLHLMHVSDDVRLLHGDFTPRNALIAKVRHYDKIGLR